MPESPRFLLLPGWLDSGPEHWQTRWERIHGCQRVQQNDWLWPRRGDWMARLDEVLLEDPRPAILIAHSLGCHLVAGWAAHSQHSARVRGALLVAPPDTERPDMPPQLANWRPIVRGSLPFASVALISRSDPYCEPARADQMAADWGARVITVEARGHLNGDSGLGDWPAGWEEVESLAAK